MRSIESYEREGRPFLDAARKAAAEQKRRADAYPELVNILWRAYHELNEIHARDGVPYTHQGIQASVTQECFTLLVEDVRALLARLENAT